MLVHPAAVNAQVWSGSPKSLRRHGPPGVLNSTVALNLRLTTFHSVSFALQGSISAIVIYQVPKFNSLYALNCLVKALSLQFHFCFLFNQSINLIIK